MTELEKFNETIAALENGSIRVAEKKDGRWQVNSWVKEVILSGFRLGKIVDMSQGQFSFLDKDTFPTRRFTEADRVRLVPGGSSVRRGAYLAPSVIVMPPAYINVGAYVDEGSMVDSHIVMLQVLETKKVGDLDVATRVSVQLQLTDPAARSRDRIVKKSEKDGFYTALDVGCVWLERALAGK